MAHHTTFKMVDIVTMRCDFCNHRNDRAAHCLQECQECNIHICRNCIEQTNVLEKNPKHYMDAEAVRGLNWTREKAKPASKRKAATAKKSASATESASPGEHQETQAYYPRDAQPAGHGQVQYGQMSLGFPSGPAFPPGANVLPPGHAAPPGAFPPALSQYGQSFGFGGLAMPQVPMVGHPFAVPHGYPGADPRVRGPDDFQSLYGGYPGVYAPARTPQGFGGPGYFQQPMGEQPYNAAGQQCPPQYGGYGSFPSVVGLTQRPFGVPAFARDQATRRTSYYDEAAARLAGSPSVHAQRLRQDDSDSDDDDAGATGTGTGTGRSPPSQPSQSPPTQHHGRGQKRGHSRASSIDSTLSAELDQPAPSPATTAPGTEALHHELQNNPEIARARRDGGEQDALAMAGAANTLHRGGRGLLGAADPQVVANDEAIRVQEILDRFRRSEDEKRAAKRQKRGGRGGGGGGGSGHGGGDDARRGGFRRGGSGGGSSGGVGA